MMKTIGGRAACALGVPGPSTFTNTGTGHNAAGPLNQT
jgi:hypothetical protein